MFFDYTLRVLVLPQTSKLRMPEVIRFGPFQKFNLGHEFRLQPNAFPHVFGSQPITPPTFVCFGKVDKRQSGTSKDRSRRNTWRREAGTNPFRTRAT
jgi:hypothetical protein